LGIDPPSITYERNERLLHSHAAAFRLYRIVFVEKFFKNIEINGMIRQTHIGSMLLMIRRLR
jgi:hypothetical protein